MLPDNSARPKRPRALRRLALFLAGGSLGLCLLAVLASALSNLGLPTHSSVIDRLRPGWKAQAFSAGAWLEDLLREAVGP